MYPTSASGITVLLKTSTKYRKFFSTLFCLFVKTTDFQLLFNFEQTRKVTIFGEHGIMAHMTLPCDVDRFLLFARLLVLL